MSKKDVQNAIEISNAHISFVSLVDKAANLRTFLITKQQDDNKAEFQTSGPILKTSDDGDKHLIYGVVYEPMTEDYHHNYMTADEIEKACHWFAKNGDKVDVQHCFVKEEGLEVVENYIAPCDMEIGGQPVTKGTWIMVTECTNDAVWEAVQKGELTGFSMGGLGDYADVDTDISKSQTDGEPSEHFINTVIKKIGAAFGFKNAITKGEVMDRYKDRAIRDCFWDAFYALLEALFNWDNQLVKEPTEIQECLEEFNQITSDLLISGKIGDLQTIDTNLLKSKGVNIMTDKEMQELIKSTAEETIKKAAEPNPDTDPAPQDPAPAEPVAKTYTQEEYDAGIKKAVEQSVAETAKQYQAAYGISKQLDGGDGEQPVKKAVFAGLV